MFFGWYTSATELCEWKKKYTEFMSMFGVVRCIVRGETVSGKISSYCFEIFEMGWG